MHRYQESGTISMSKLRFAQNAEACLPRVKSVVRNASMLKRIVELNERRKEKPKGSAPAVVVLPLKARLNVKNVGTCSITGQ
jgi:hypothetical protein